MDRFDLRVEVPQVAVEDLGLPRTGETSAVNAARVAQARRVQRERFDGHGPVAVNADAEGELLASVAALTTGATDLLAEVTRKFRLSARAYHRILRVARTIADLEASQPVEKPHVAEAAGYRLAF
jgi:magnesium chelatase family protein